MMSQVYTVFFVYGMVMLLTLILAFKNKVSVYYTLYFTTVAITNLGYMQIASATDTETALFANQVVYLGASFSPFFMLECVADLCKIEIKRWAEILFIVYGGILIFLTSTIGKLDWYYVSVSLSTHNGISFLEKTYGPLHILYPIYLFVAVLLAIIFIVKSFKSKKEVSHVTSITLWVSCTAAISVYLVEKIGGLHVELMPISHAILELVVFILLNRISLYNVTAISTDSMMESLSHGFVLTDSKSRYLGSDNAAKVWFPELTNIRVDTSILKHESPLISQIIKWNAGEDENHTILLTSGETIIEASHTIIQARNRRPLHCVYLRDDTKQQQYVELVEQYNSNLEHDVEIKSEKLSKVLNDIIVSMASIVENRDNNTGGHIARTSDVVEIFVKHMMDQNLFPEMTKSVAKSIIKAAPLHDFGKVAVPDVILNKPGKFTPEEFEQMKEHSAKGAVIVGRILKNSENEEFKKIAVNVAHFHHERWDGSGYPMHLSGEDIPFEARVMALADVFDALVSKRVYKDSFSYDKAFSIIEESCGTHFEPVLCKAFLECRPKLEALYNSYED